jgi:hypothetical protein
MARFEINGELLKTHHTFFEFVEATNREGVTHDDWGSGAIIEKTDSFYGNIKSYDDMYNACYSGMNAKKMKSKTAELSSLLNHEREQPRKALVGETLNVAAFCEGNPYHFYKDVDEYAKPRVHIAYSTNAVCGVKSSEFIRYGAAICALVEQLAEQVDVKVSLYITNTGVFGKDRAAQIVTIKDYDEVVDISRVAATAHPSFFRRIGFTWFENPHLVSSELRNSGHGCSHTGGSRTRVISNEEFDEWLGRANDEMVIDMPAPDKSWTSGDHSTAVFLEEAINEIEIAVERGKERLELHHL